MQLAPRHGQTDDFTANLVFAGLRLREPPRLPLKLVGACFQKSRVGPIARGRRQRSTCSSSSPGGRWNLDGGAWHQCSYRDMGPS
jgi:hypothetical protein